MARTPLTSRPFDLVYFIFFLSHIPATVLLDLQAIYPVWIVPGFIAQLPKLYLQLSNDPIIEGALSTGPTFLWLRTFMVLEALFQLPTFVIGARGLYKGSKSIYPLLLVYAASTSTTVLPCLAVILATPSTSPETLSAKLSSVSPEQRALLLASYIPFFLIPLLMTLDMALRLSSLVQKAVQAERAVKTK
ncbi:hypothetical protein PUNSTDRAFT_113088 [Punctularia strigosozonata HHB-11173 SS5]|uniref:uncharacterized protein n=1 Tax=Punctularia strigosozonata (strain HHB-11173) TaxID=741275 RepID=UPI0004416FAD|nr:uncharacterized protein PUNSTDRAFT_113088 [Punctularia strigosozonata HHB-11173 SS5]EIN09658.1 hypothetical protein PUNSTDRAFT_113088 [Punctularia strigosozonata HHB-11173 SS5]